jgi:hypothetical protein
MKEDSHLQALMALYVFSDLQHEKAILKSRLPAEKCASIFQARITLFTFDNKCLLGSSMLKDRRSRVRLQKRPLSYYQSI